MKKLDLSMVTNEVEEMCMAANYYVDPKVLEKLKRAHCGSEKSPLAKNVLQQILENDAIAEEEQVPMCQDTGMRSEEHTSELQSRQYLVCRLLLEKKKKRLSYFSRLMKKRAINSHIRRH